jgi:hypothetical protein
MHLSEIMQDPSPLKKMKNVLKRRRSGDACMKQIAHTDLPMVSMPLASQPSWRSMRFIIHVVIQIERPILKAQVWPFSLSHAELSLKKKLTFTICT